MSGAPDPATLPPGHPLRKLATSLGVAGPAGAPQGPAQGFPSGPQGRPPQAQRPAQVIQPQAQAAQRAPDPLGRPFTLPSGGLLYGDHSGSVIISPMRGEQEEIIAGAGEGLSATPTLRHVVQQCVDCQGIPYEKLELSDWSALLLHIFSLSLGEDNIPLFPVCPTCNTQFDGSRSLSMVPCRVLRRAAPGEATTWPPETAQDEDEDLRILREMGIDSSTPQSAEQAYISGPLVEPIEVPLANGQTIGVRYLRLEDLIQAEDFAERSQSTQATTPGAKLHSFIHARQIATIDGKSVGVLDAMRWVKQTPMPLLAELRLAVERRSFGYELSPSFKCPRGHSFRQQLPLNGAMFRRRLGTQVR